jgi:hypothetical protein
MPNSMKTIAIFSLLMEDINSIDTFEFTQYGMKHMERKDGLRLIEFFSGRFNGLLTLGEKWDRWFWNWCLVEIYSNAIGF